jgi:peptidoglycan/LPS O-acetylase OafA/YrhL
MKYEPSLDGLRAIAVTSVVIYHANDALLPGGWAGVDVFFVLSGFLISTLLLKEVSTSNTINLRKFYTRRALRLMPAFACLIAVLLPVSWFGGHYRAKDFYAIIMAVTYLMNWNRSFGWFPGDGGFLGHTWSLAMEEQFYVIWPLTLICLARWRRAAPFLILGLITLVFSWRLFLVYSGAGPERTYMGFDTHSDALFMGCAIAFASLGSRTKLLLRQMAIIPIVLLASILLTFHWRSSLTQGVGLSLAGLSSAWIMLAALQDGFLKKFLSLPPLVYTGRISYGWYLWHYPILAVATHLLPRSYGTALLVVVSYLTAVMSYHFVERPFLKLKDRFEPKAVATYQSASLGQGDTAAFSNPLP